MIGKSDVLFAHAPTNPVLAAVLTSQFPSLTNAPSLLHSMDMQPAFMQGEPSENVATLLECIQLADPASPDITMTTDMTVGDTINSQQVVSAHHPCLPPGKTLAT
jgi:hypothetical protein